MGILNLIRKINFNQKTPTKNIYCSQKVGDIRILKIIAFTKRMSYT